MSNDIFKDDSKQKRILDYEVAVDKLFAQDVWALAFGYNGWNNAYTHEDVLYRLRQHCVKALAWDRMYHDHEQGFKDEDTEEDYEMREKMDTYYKQGNIDSQYYKGCEE